MNSFIDLQGKGSNQIILGEVEASIDLGETARFGVEGNVSTKSQQIVPNNTREVDSWVLSQSHAGADTSVVMQILKLNLYERGNKEL